MLSMLSDRLIQKLVSKDGIRVTIRKSTLHSPPMCCHLKLLIKLFLNQLVMLCLIYHRSFVVAIYDSNWYIKRLKLSIITIFLKCVILGRLFIILYLNWRHPYPCLPCFKTYSYGLGYGSCCLIFSFLCSALWIIVYSFSFGHCNCVPSLD
jgi:hypothetical protein